MRSLLALLMLLTFAPAVSALDADEMFADPALEQRARDLGRQLRCVKCRNQSIFDSNAGIAKDMRVIVRERIAAGDTDAEVLAWLEERYGDYVLLKPQFSAQNAVLWAAPVGLVIVALIGAGMAFRRQGATSAPPLSEADRAEAQALLAGKDA